MSHIEELQKKFKKTKLKEKTETHSDEEESRKHLIFVLREKKVDLYKRYRYSF